MDCDHAPRPVRRCRGRPRRAGDSLDVRPLQLAAAPDDRAGGCTSDSSDGGVVGEA
ncbi:hypothetical protein HBB16_01300 [Pseudonocardia sp. MCCB 268]|nr:hypothetical protein [Pseudonocardia cytotoxica]